MELLDLMTTEEDVEELLRYLYGPLVPHEEERERHASAGLSNPRRSLLGGNCNNPRPVSLGWDGANEQNGKVLTNGRF